MQEVRFFNHEFFQLSQKKLCNRRKELENVKGRWVNRGKMRKCKL